MLIQEIVARICKAVSVILPHPDRHHFINAQTLSRKRPILDTSCHHAKRKSNTGPAEDESVTIPLMTSTPQRISGSTSAISPTVTVRLWFNFSCTSNI